MRVKGKGEFPILFFSRSSVYQNQNVGGISRKLNDGKRMRYIPRSGELQKATHR